MFEGRPILICATARPDSPAMPLSVIRQCEVCQVDVLTAPSSKPMIDQGAHVCCMDCGLVEAALVGADEFEPVPGSLEEVANLLGPQAAVQTQALVDAFNRARRRSGN